MEIKGDWFLYSFSNLFGHDVFIAPMKITCSIKPSKKFIEETAYHDLLYHVGY